MLSSVSAVAQEGTRPDEGLYTKRTGDSLGLRETVEKACMCAGNRKTLGRDEAKERKGLTQW